MSKVLLNVCVCGAKYHVTDEHSLCPSCMAKVEPDHYEIAQQKTDCDACTTLARTVFHDRRTQFRYFNKTGEWHSIRAIRTLMIKTNSENNTSGELSKPLVETPDQQSGPRGRTQSGHRGRTQSQSGPKGRTQSQSGSREHTEGEGAFSSQTVETTHEKGVISDNPVETPSGTDQLGHQVQAPGEGEFSAKHSVETTHQSSPSSGPGVFSASSVETLVPPQLGAGDVSPAGSVPQHDSSPRDEHLPRDQSPADPEIDSRKTGSSLSGHLGQGSEADYDLPLGQQQADHDSEGSEAGSEGSHISLFVDEEDDYLPDPLTPLEIVRLTGRLGEARLPQWLLAGTEPTDAQILEARRLLEAPPSPPNLQPHTRSPVRDPVDTGTNPVVQVHEENFPHPGGQGGRSGRSQVHAQTGGLNWDTT